MYGESFKFKLSGEVAEIGYAHGMVFEAKLFDQEYTVSHEGESVSYTFDEVDEAFGIGHWELIEEM